MKNTFSFFGVQCRSLYAIVFALLVGFSFAACDNRLAPQPEVIEPGTLPSLHLSIAPNVQPWYGFPGRPNELHRNDWRSTTVSLTSPTDDYERFAFEPVNARARGRGNSSWWMHEKRPMRFRFDRPQSMFGSSYEATDWSLISNAMDYTLMRNYAAYFLGSLLSGLDYSPSRHFVHLYLDGDYRGVYMLTDQIHVHRGRVELASHNIPALSEYFLEWCYRVRWENAGAPNTYFILEERGDTGISFGISYPGSSALNNNRGYRDFAENFVRQVDAAFRSRNFAEISQVIDINSFIDYYLVQEFFQNMDVGFSSLFFQIRQTNAGPRLFAGPLWDFDLSSGSAIGHYSDSQPPRSGDCLPIDQPIARWWNPWFGDLMGTPEFRDRVVARWNMIRDNEVRTMMTHINRLAIRYQACFDRNFERWDEKLGHYTWRNSVEVVAIPADKGHMGQVDFLIDWLERRKVLMNNFLRW